MRTEHRYVIQFGCHTKIPTSGNRNYIVKLFLESKNDFLLMLDNDTAPRSNLLDMVEKDLDVVGFPCPVWRGIGTPEGVAITWNFSPLDGSEKIHMGEQDLMEVAQIGGGAILIARRVLEHPNMKAPFIDQFDEDGVREVGHDYLFCRRARDAGFQVWAATKHLCGHVKDRDLIEVFKAYQTEDKVKDNG